MNRFILTAMLVAVVSIPSLAVHPHFGPAGGPESLYLARTANSERNWTGETQVSTKPLSQGTGGNMFAGMPQDYKDALVLEAKADIQRYEAKVRIATGLLAKARTDEKYVLKRVIRMRKLFDKSAISADELERNEQLYEQNIHNQSILKSFIDEDKAKLESSKARLKQAIAIQKIP